LLFLYGGFWNNDYLPKIFKNIFFHGFNNLLRLFYLRKFSYKIISSSFVFCWLTNNTKNLKIFYYYNFLKLFLIKNTKFTSLKYFILKNYGDSPKKFKVFLKLFIKVVLKRLEKRFVFFFLKLLSWSLLYFLSKFSKLIFFFFFF
jgi:hypothetical protein